jgi:hypothetical protein
MPRCLKHVGCYCQGECKEAKLREIYLLLFNCEKKRVGKEAEILDEC